MITMVHLLSFYGCGAEVVGPGSTLSLEIADASLPAFHGEIRVRVKSGRAFNPDHAFKISKTGWPVKS